MWFGILSYIYWQIKSSSPSLWFSLQKFAKGNVSKTRPCQPQEFGHKVKQYGAREEREMALRCTVLWQNAYTSNKGLLKIHTGIDCKILPPLFFCVSFVIPPVHKLTRTHFCGGYRPPWWGELSWWPIHFAWERHHHLVHEFLLFVLRAISSNIVSFTEQEIKSRN